MEASGHLFVLDRVAPHVHVLDSDDYSHLLSFGQEGDGPYEFRGINSLSVESSGGSVWAYDAGLRRLTRLTPFENWPERIRGRPDEGMIQLKGQYGVLDPQFIDDTTIVAVALSSEARLVFYDRHGDVRGVVDNTISLDLPPEAQTAATYSRLAVQPGTGNIAATMVHSSSVEVYSRQGRLLGIGNGPLPVEPIFEVVEANDRAVLAFGEDTQYGYVCLAPARDRLVALFSGRRQGDYPGKANLARELHVFDWDGRYVEAVRLDRAVINISLADDGASLLAVRRDPLPAIVRFDLSDRLEKGGSGARVVR